MVKIKLTPIEKPEENKNFIIPNRSFERILVLSKFGGIKRYTVEVIATGIKNEQSELISCAEFLSDYLKINSLSKVYEALTKKI